MTRPLDQGTLDLENMAGIARVTCGWKKAHLPLEPVRRYWRDVHSPAISRRAGVWDYRHMQFDDVRTDLLAPTPPISFHCPADEQLMWLSDVRYRDEASLAAFGASPPKMTLAHLLADIDLIVDQSTTYKAVGENARTLRDALGSATPQGPVAPGTRFAMFLRQRGEEAPFRAAVKAMARRWAETPGVRRVRVSLFDAPDMEAEKKAGYPIKTHPVPLQYQASIDLAIEDASVGWSLLVPEDAAEISTIHAYPLASHFTFVFAGRPTLVGLRGYAAYQVIGELSGFNQAEPDLLRWMYGPAVGDGPYLDGGSAE